MTGSPVLEHALADDDLERRAALREVVEAFAAADPCVQQGLVTSWTVRSWAVVVPA